MEPKSGEFFFCKTFFEESKKNQRGDWRRRNGEEESVKIMKC